MFGRCPAGHPRKLPISTSAASEPSRARSGPRALSALRTFAATQMDDHRAPYGLAPLAAAHGQRSRSRSPARPGYRAYEGDRPGTTYYSERGALEEQHAGPSSSSVRRAKVGSVCDTCREWIVRPARAMH